mgnify:FL=1
MTVILRTALTTRLIDNKSYAQQGRVLIFQQFNHNDVYFRITLYLVVRQNA